MLPEGDQLNMTLKQCLAHIDVCMGGRIAEELSGLYQLTGCPELA